MKDIKPRKVDRTEIFELPLDGDIIEIEYGLSVMGEKDLPKVCSPFTLEIVEFLYKEKKHKYLLHNGNRGPPFIAYPIEDQRLRKSLIEKLPKYVSKVIEQNVNFF